MKTHAPSLADIKEIVQDTRNNDNTTWLLRAARRDPNCVIVVADHQQRQHLCNTYYSMLPWYRKLRFVQWLLPIRFPKFLLITQSFKGIRTPLVFDNGVFLRFDNF